ncbi:TPA: hypothetical protein N0F65_002669 [Lagenidium giganteum]|uniref:DUF4460 domain-containing protein n=1 Tax=Lagenidium giganteum TaxID=4803 RepID=A0AAV2Z4R6_9STRA|nr:TPA: hypothetical protein N0F65_002669 [Lagenidium giganteum]
MTRRSSVVRQFLLRVHPDHFRTMPRVHDENLQSMQLLNHFIDEHASSSATNAWHRLGAGANGGKQVRPRSSSSPSDDDLVHFNLFTRSGKDVQRFALTLSTATLERNMRSILTQCGVVLPKDASAASTESSGSAHGSAKPSTARASSASSSSTSRRRTRPQTDRKQDTWTPPEYDFPFGSMDDMHRHFRQQESASRRKRVRLRTLDDLLAFMEKPETQEQQQQLARAWASIQSVKNTLKREFGIHEVRCTCGWASLHLNATIIMLLRTIRQYARAHAGGILTPEKFLMGATIDISSRASSIDFWDEYVVHFNPADVPLQWVEMLEQIDSRMVGYMRGAQQSLAALQRDATAALADVQIVRGHTCSSSAYRSFLQTMTADPTIRAASGNGEGTLVGQVTIRVEKDGHNWKVLENSDVQVRDHLQSQTSGVPAGASASAVRQFVHQQDEHIRSRRQEHEADTQRFELIARACVDVFGFRSLTISEGLRLADAVAAGEALLKHATTSPGRAAIIRQSTQGHSICVGRSFGLGQDGCFTIPHDWDS